MVVNIENSPVVVQSNTVCSVASNSHVIIYQNAIFDFASFKMYLNSDFERQI